MLRRYSELILLPTFEERFEYLRLNGVVGSATFGYSRYINQALYQSLEWRKVRDAVIFRDNGCDLAIEGRPIIKYALVHHINPITEEDIINRDPKIFDMDNLITVTHNTHQAIHYGDISLLLLDPVTRRPNDTCPWKET